MQRIFSIRLVDSKLRRIGLCSDDVVVIVRTRKPTETFLEAKYEKISFIKLTVGAHSKNT